MEYMEENLHEWLGEELEVLPLHTLAPCLPRHTASKHTVPVPGVWRR